MNKGKYVFSQIMTYFPKWVFEGYHAGSHVCQQGLDIANIYRNRWQIETFFKWINRDI